jgi:hypothetical protein
MGAAPPDARRADVARRSGGQPCARLPLPPLDGSGALPLVLKPETARAYQEFLWRTPGLGLLGLMVAWRLCDVVFDPIFFGAVSWLYPGVSYS